MTLNLTETSVAKSRPSVPYGANFHYSVFLSASVSCFHERNIGAIARDLRHIVERVVRLCNRGAC